MPLATFKHITSKNADYGAAEAYLLYAHDEFTNKPIRDEQGRLVPRSDYSFTSLNCGEEDFAIACIRANLRFGKNQKREDVKSHHYIISFDPRDKEDAGLTMDRAEGKGVGFERWAKVHNLKQAAKAWNAFEASGFATPEELEAACEEARTEYRDAQAALRGVEEAIQAKKTLQFHVLQYCKTKPLRQEWKTLRSEKARTTFRAQHESDLLRMEAAKRYFDQQGLQKLPSYKTLQREIEGLVQEKNQLYRRYLPAREKFRELDTMRHNLRQLLRQPEQDRQREVR